MRGRERGREKGGGGGGGQKTRARRQGEKVELEEMSLQVEEIQGGKRWKDG